MLNPQTPLFREARYLLAEETEIRDPSLYHSVLAAVAEGNATSGGIASYIGRKSYEVAHPLRVLEDCRLLIKEPDLFRSGRMRYRIVEPLVTFYRAIMSRDLARLEIGDGPTVWRSARPRFLSQVAGPHFEAICRDYAIAAGPEMFGGLPSEVGAGVVSDPSNRTQIEIDVAVLAPAEHGRPRKILSLGEAKWDRIMDIRDVERLHRARDLLAVKGFDTSNTVLSCFPVPASAVTCKLLTPMKSASLALSSSTPAAHNSAGSVGSKTGQGSFVPDQLADLVEEAVPAVRAPQARR